MTRVRSLLLAGGLTVLVIAAALGFSARLVEGGGVVSGASSGAAGSQPGAPTDVFAIQDRTGQTSGAERAARFEVEPEEHDDEEQERRLLSRGSARRYEGRASDAIYEHDEDDEDDD